jgi:hypothetical protein
MRIAALEQEHSVIKTPEGDNREDVASRHKYYIFRNSETARLGRIDVGPTSQWTCSRRWQEISTEITTTEVNVDRDLAPIAALECQQLVDALTQRLPRELREKIYEWLVPTESFNITLKSCLKILPTTSEPHVIPHAPSRHGFSFSMFYCMKGGHFAEI